MKKTSLLIRIAIYLFIALLFSFYYSQGQIETNSETKVSFNSFPKLTLGSFIVTEHLTEIDILSVDNIEIIETITIQNNQNETGSILLSLNQTYGSLSIRDIDGQLPFEFVNDTNLININLRSSLNTSNDITLWLRYDLLSQLDLISGNPSYYILQFEKFFSYLTHQHIISVRLPIGSFLHADKLSPTPCFPTDYSKVLSGKRLIISWENENLESFSTTQVLLRFDEPISGSNAIWGYFVGPTLGMILGGIFVYLWMKRGTKKLEEEIEKIYLTKNQELLLKLIEAEEGKVTQQELISITKFTKSKVSRNLTPLEENGLIHKEKWGREYKVSLSKKGEKVVKNIVAEKFHFFEKLTEPDFSKKKKDNIEMRKNEDK